MLLDGGTLIHYAQYEVFSCMYADQFIANKFTFNKSGSFLPAHPVKAKTGRQFFFIHSCFSENCVAGQTHKNVVKINVYNNRANRTEPVLKYVAYVASIVLALRAGRVTECS